MIIGADIVPKGDDDEDRFDPNQIGSWIKMVKKINDTFSMSMLKGILMALVGEMDDSTQVSVKMKGVKLVKTKVVASQVSDNLYLEGQKINGGDGFDQGDDVFLIAINKEIFYNIFMKLMDTGMFDGSEEEEDEED